MEIIKRIRLYIFAWQTRRAIKKAIHYSQLDGRRYMVLNIQGRPRVIAQANVKALIKRHTFRKGMTIDDIRRRALFITR